MIKKIWFWISLYKFLDQVESEISNFTTVLSMCIVQFYRSHFNVDKIRYQMLDSCSLLSIELNSGLVRIYWEIFLELQIHSMSSKKVLWLNKYCLYFHVFFFFYISLPKASVNINIRSYSNFQQFLKLLRISFCFPYKGNSIFPSSILTSPSRITLPRLGYISPWLFKILIMLYTFSKHFTNFWKSNCVYNFLFEAQKRAKLMKFVHFWVVVRAPKNGLTHKFKQFWCHFRKVKNFAHFPKMHGKWTTYSWDSIWVFFPPEMFCLIFSVFPWRVRKHRFWQWRGSWLIESHAFWLLEREREKSNDDRREQREAERDKVRDKIGIWAGYPRIMRALCLIFRERNICFSNFPILQKSFKFGFLSNYLHILWT